MSPQRQAKNRAAAEQMIARIPLGQSAGGAGVDAGAVGGIAGVKQAFISKLERRADMYVTTLRKFIEAMGGKLEIRAVFPGGSVRITEFGEKRSSRG